MVRHLGVYIITSGYTAHYVLMVCVTLGMSAPHGSVITLPYRAYTRALPSFVCHYSHTVSDDTQVVNYLIYWMSP